MIGRASEDESAVVNIFDMINDGSVSEYEYNGIQDDVRFQWKVANANRRSSRKYVRPIYKEPGSKITPKSNEIEEDEHLFGAIPLDWKKAIESLPNIVNTLSYRSHTESPIANNDNGSLFRTSREEVYQSRLEYLVGNAKERHKSYNVDNPATIRSRFLQRFNQVHSYADPKIESRIATMGDIDILESKKLRPKRATSKADDSLRKEINKIVSSNLDRREISSRRLPKRYNDFGEEEREGYEGCVYHGCVGVELQDLLNDMKDNFFRQDK